MNACTIIAKNYVAQARVLARSFLAHHPGGRFFTLVIDEIDGYIDPADEPFEVLGPRDIGCAPFDEMSARYSIIELSTAVKPWLLRHLMATTAGPITYLDPDIQVFDSLERLDGLARAHGLVLTPHNTSPIPDDGRRPSQIDIMIAGVYNLGYVSMAPGKQAERLLDWWSERLERDCRVDPVYGYFVDQRWFDLAPGFADDYAVVRDPEFNIAYWNLHTRTLAHDGERYTVNGRPLAFFHFSGFDPEDSDRVSRHQDRIHLHDNPALRRIFSDYAKAALAEGFATARNWPYTYGFLADGTPFDDVLRHLYVAADRQGRSPGPPFTPEGTEKFVAWLRESPEDSPPGINRVLAEVYGTRPDLRKQYPDVFGADRDRFLQWARSYGVEEVPSLARLGSDEPAPLPAVTSNGASAPWGVNVVGYWRSELGVAEAARQVLQALDAHRVPTLPIHGETIPPNRQGHAFTYLDAKGARYPVNLICMNADALPEFASQAGDEFFAGRDSIGLWFWEVSKFPERWHSSFDLLREVWVASAHVADALRPVSPIPVVQVRVPVVVPMLVPRTRAELGMPDGFCFLFSFDYNSVFARKNPIAVIEAFRQAFSPTDSATLLIKTINADNDPEDHARVLAAADGHAGITVLDSYLDAVDKDAMTAQCDCYVSLHRSEGFGLTMAEAMYLGKPVIATGYSGNLDFMDADNSLLVDYELVPVGPGAGPYPEDAEWAEPDVAHAAALMRQIFDDRDAAAQFGARAADSIQRTHGTYQAGVTMATRLDELRDHSASSVNGTPVASGALQGLIARGPAPGPRGRLGAAGRAARKAVLRALRPYTAYQAAVNRDVAKALTVLTAESQEGLRGQSAILAQLRAESGLHRVPAVLEAHAALLDDLKRATSRPMQTDRGLYVALAELAERHEAITQEGDPSRPASGLSGSELRVFSQNGEDGVLAEIFARIGVANRFFVEFGIEDGREGNSVFLADVTGWRGVFLEADGDKHPILAEKYRGTRVETVRAMVDPDNVEDLFASAGVPEDLDLLSIDVDGTDYWIWEAIARYRPRVVVVEYNASLDPAVERVQPRDHVGGWNGTSYYGASLAALNALARRKGYRLVHTETTGVNAFYVREELCAGRFPEESDVLVRGRPDYFHLGYEHPPGDGPYVDPSGKSE